jgi:hypothetical protein
MIELVLILFGVRGRVRTVGQVTMQCPVCGMTCAQALREAKRYFTLFFIPIFPVSHNYALVCASCGQGRKIDKTEAEQMKQYLAGHALASAGGGFDANGPGGPGGPPPMGWSPPAGIPAGIPPSMPPPTAPPIAPGSPNPGSWPAPVPPDPGTTPPAADS